MGKNKEYRARLAEMAKTEKKKEKDAEIIREKTAKEAIEFGVIQLSRFLDHIKEKDGNLPSVIIYPDTSIRPLRYAIAPLLKEKYKSCGQKMPSEYFFKVFSGARYNGVYKFYIDEYERKIQRLRLKIKLLRERVNQQQYLYDNTDDEKSKNKIRQLIQELEKNIISLQQEINIAMYKRSNVPSSEEALKIENNRLRQMLTSESDSVLVVDDVWASGHTMWTMQKIFERNGIKRANYFVFVDGGSLHSNFNGDIQCGVYLSGWADIDRIGDKCGKIINDSDLISDPDVDRWYKIIQNGFPYRSMFDVDKQARIGVFKDISNKRAYAEISSARDGLEIKKIRKKYEQWGVEALNNLK
ncbi:hypothetical protein D6827_00240 [Candidatus Parcubacteria bacterium]|nr:MAG: hypothetical protein D6827_00240 [Candidatus Parcubacteria bacterium]